MADEGDEERRCQHIPDESETLDSSASNDSLDLMIGAERIATFMFSDPEETRQVYHIWKSHGLPAFKVGNAQTAALRGLRGRSR